MYIDEETKKKNRIFSGLDYVWAALVGATLAIVAVNALQKWGFFENAVIDGWLGKFDLREMAVSLSRLGVFLVGAIVTLILRKEREERNRRD
jgi:hypothetical protein